MLLTDDRSTLEELVSYHVSSKCLPCSMLNEGSELGAEHEASSACASLAGDHVTPEWETRGIPLGVAFR